MIDWYALLGVPTSASSDEIKRVYRRLARKYHPDVSKIQDAEAKFKEILKAYRTLKDPDRRHYYDELREKVHREPNVEPHGERDRHGQSRTTPTKSFARKGLRWLILLLWKLTGIGARMAREAAVLVLTLGLVVFQSIFPLVAITLIAAGLLFEGNPFHWATWNSHPQLTFLCFGFPVAAFLVAMVVYRLTEWLAHDGPLFPSLESRINDIRSRTLCF